MNLYQQCLNLINQSSSIVITSHKSPDGDSIGSSIALYWFIKKLGKNVRICHPDAGPSYLDWIEGFEAIRCFEKESEEVTKLMKNADLIFCLDYNSSDRMGAEMGNLLDQSTAKKILIDHHPSPADFPDVLISDTNIGSTAQMIFELIEQSGKIDLLDIQMGSAIYLGIMTDTGSFRFPSVQARTHEILAKLLNIGVKHYEIHEKVFDSNTLDRLRLRGFATSDKIEVLENYPVAIISLTDEELQRFNFQKGDTDGLVNVALSIKGIMMAVVFVERDGLIKISFRSKGNWYVNQLAADHFEGGGHKYAAGGISKTSMEEAVHNFKTYLPEYAAH